MHSLTNDQSLSGSSQCVTDLLESAYQRIHQASHSPSLDADILLAHVLGCNRSALKAWPDKIVSTEHKEQFDALIEKRATGKPIAYLLGSKGFWNLLVDVDEHTLVPRPETELLVEHALKLIPENSEQVIADICTGSGAIAFALASERPDCEVHACDIDGMALRVANRSLARLQLDNVAMFKGDLFSALPEDNYDLIVSNPPYIAADDQYLLHPSMQHEPRHALIAENNGLAIIEQLVSGAKTYLKPNGYLLLEHGHEQSLDIQEMAQRFGLDYQMCLQDFQALDRVSVLQYLI